MDELNVVNDTRQAVVEPAGAQNGAALTGTPGGAEAEPTARRQSAAENSGFRKMRLEIESLRKQLSEREDERVKSDAYLDALVRDRMQRDLEAVREIDPGVRRLTDPGEDFIRLIECGVDAKVAFSAVRAAKEAGSSRKPPETGAVGVRPDATGEFFSSRELDRLTSRDLDDPAIFKKAMRSLKKL